MSSLDSVTKLGLHKFQQNSPAPGRTMQRLKNLEDQNEYLIAKVEELTKWKSSLEKWIVDEFGLVLPEEGDNENEVDIKYGIPGFSVDQLVGNGAYESTSTNAISDGLDQLMNTKDSPTSFVKDLSQTNKLFAGDTDPLDIDPVSESRNIGSNIVIRNGYNNQKNHADSLNQSFFSADDSDSRELNNAQSTPNAGTCLSHSGKIGKAIKAAQASAAQQMEISAILNENGPDENVINDKSKISIEIPLGRKSRETEIVLRNGGTHSQVGEGNVEDNTPCDVCRDIYPEKNNEMVFCDKCNICVHQACYGVVEVPKGIWWCKTCVEDIEPNTQECRFCTTKGGAMTRVKSPSRQAWAHVSCAWWIPGLSFNDPVNLDFVFGIPSIDRKRWNLVCALCKGGKGSTCCIQCSYKRCTLAFHATCALQDRRFKMTMRDDNTGRPDGVILAAFCPKHIKEAESVYPNKSNNVTPSTLDSIHSIKRRSSSVSGIKEDRVRGTPSKKESETPRQGRKASMSPETKKAKTH